MARKVQGDFKYLVDYMNKNKISIAQATKIVGREYSTVRNWLYGLHLKKAILTTDETQKQADRNVASLIAKITGDSKEVVLDEIQKYLLSEGEIEVLETSVSGTLRKLIEDIKCGKVKYMRSDKEMTLEKKRQVIMMLENDLRMMKTL